MPHKALPGYHPGAALSVIGPCKANRLKLVVFFSLLLVAILAFPRSLRRLGALTQHLHHQTALSKHIPIIQKRYAENTTMTSPDYSNPPQLPPVWNYTPDKIAAVAEEHIATQKSTLDEIVAATTPENANFDNTLHPSLVGDNVSAGSIWQVTFLQNVHSDPAIREASLKADGKVREAGIEQSMRDDMFQRINAVFNKYKDSADLGVEEKTILSKEHKKYVNKGLLLPPGPERDRFKEIQLEISRKCLEAQNNNNKETGGSWFRPEELQGIPKTEIDIDELEKGTGDNEGKVKLNYKYTTSTPLQRYAQNASVRRDYYIQESNKVNNNVPLFKEIILLRDEAARLLGYKDHADLVISAKMAKDAEKVKTFLNDIKSRVGDGGKGEIAVLNEIKKKDYAQRGLEYDGEFYHWDTSYYTRILKETQYSLNEAKVSEYFPVWTTFRGMLEIFEKLFDLKFVELDEAAKARLSSTGNAKDVVWHEEVVLCSVWNGEASGGDFIGYLYVDLHPRDNKYSHNANFGLQPGFLKPDGSRSYPVTSLVCNFSRASKGRPALLKHSEVITLFHELGHGIHDLVAKTKYSYCHGTSVMWDFVEAPSQMLENWCWTQDILQGLSSHWETKEKIPDDLVEKMMRTKHLNESIGTLYQLLIGIFDLKVHSPESREALKAMNCALLFNSLRGEITGMKGPEDAGYGLEWGHRYATIGHYVGGYDAGYYGYLYSQVFSTDMFYTAFKKDPMNAEAGRRYRKLILERGGSMDENEMLREFLGREPSPEAFYKELGLA